jgi:hypothetical protein
VDFLETFSCTLFQIVLLILRGNIIIMDILHHMNTTTMKVTTIINTGQAKM